MSDLSDNTDAGFYAPNADYEVRVEGITVNTQTINAFMGVFSIENSRKPSGVSNITDNSSDEIHAGVLSVQSQLASLFAATIMISIGFLADMFSVGLGIIIVSFVVLLLYPLMRIR